MNNFNEQELPPEIAKLAEEERKRKKTEATQRDEEHHVSVEATKERLKPWLDPLTKLANLGLADETSRKWMSQRIAESNQKTIFESPERNRAHNSVTLFKCRDEDGRDIMYTLEWRNLGPSAKAQTKHKPLGAASMDTVSIEGHHLYKDDTGETYRWMRPRQGSMEMWYSPNRIIVRKMGVSAEAIDDYKLFDRLSKHPLVGLEPDEKGVWAVDPEFMRQTYGSPINLEQFESDKDKRRSMKQQAIALLGEDVSDKNIKIVQPDTRQIDGAIFRAAQEAERAGINPEEIMRTAGPKLEMMKKEALSNAK